MDGSTQLRPKDVRSQTSIGDPIAMAVGAVVVILGALGVFARLQMSPDSIAALTGGLLTLAAVARMVVDAREATRRAVALNNREAAAYAAGLVHPVPQQRRYQAAPAEGGPVEIEPADGPADGPANDDDRETAEDEPTSSRSRPRGRVARRG